MNNFYNDSHVIFKALSKKIADSAILTDMDAIHNTLFFALGIEKMLKGILYDINPVFILEDGDFKNSFAIYYKNKLISSSQNTKDIRSEPNEDVIAFHNSVIRATLVNQAAYDHKNSLMRLKNYRDIIVHNSFDKLNIDELKTILNRDFYVILSAFSKELEWSNICCFNNLHSKLALIASSLEQDIEKKLALKIESSQGKWEVRKNQNLNHYKRITRELLLNDDYAYPTECPCCNNNAVVFTKPIMEYNQYIKKEIQSGYETIKFQCSYCSLFIEDYKELDILNIKPNIDEKSLIIEQLESPINLDTGTASKWDLDNLSSNGSAVAGDPVNFSIETLKEINKPDKKKL